MYFLYIFKPAESFRSEMCTFFVPGAISSSTSTGLFGNNQNASSTTGLFGSTTNSAFGQAKPSFGGFGTTQTTSLFGQQAAAQAQPQSTNIFGQTSTTSNTGLFGSSGT